MTLPDFFKAKPPKLFMQEEFIVRTYECGAGLSLGITGLINFLQEIAGNHANSIGLGIEPLQKQGLTWMLARMRISLRASLPHWGGKLIVTTWPSGVRGRLIAVRDFIVQNENGETIAKAFSEWPLVNFETLRLARLTPEVLALTEEGTLHVALPDIGAISTVKETLAVDHTVRRSDMDTNRHVNNMHYTEWALESIPEAFQQQHRLTEIDIHFKQAAYAGETVRSETDVTDNGILEHRVLNAKTDALLAQLKTAWSTPA